jgi:hypothetical protein
MLTRPNLEGWETVAQHDLRMSRVGMAFDGWCTTTEEIT